MTNFEWLNALATENWGKTVNGYDLRIKRSDFAKRSNAAINTDLHHEFEMWSTTQRHRNYTIFDAPNVDGEPSFLINMTEHSRI